MDDAAGPRDRGLLRFHGPEALYGSGYSDAQLREWAKRIRDWLASGLEVYAYFNNDVPDHAPRDAQRLRELIGGPAARALPGLPGGEFVPRPWMRPRSTGSAQE